MTVHPFAYQIQAATVFVAGVFAGSGDRTDVESALLECQVSLLISHSAADPDSVSSWFILLYCLTDGWPNTWGNMCLNSDGKKGMQAQMMAMSHSTTLQYTAGVLSSERWSQQEDGIVQMHSQVRLDDLENLTSDCNRKQLTTVMLAYCQQVDRDPSSEVVILQETSAEHQEQLRLFLLVECQLHQRLNGKADDSEVHCDLHGGLIPRVCVDVDACAFVLASPSFPEEPHWRALEDHHEGVGYAEACG